MLSCGVARCSMSHAWAPEVQCCGIRATTIAFVRCFRPSQAAGIAKVMRSAEEVTFRCFLNVCYVTFMGLSWVLIDVLIHFLLLYMYECMLRFLNMILTLFSETRVMVFVSESSALYPWPINQEQYDQKEVGAASSNVLFAHISYVPWDRTLSSQVVLTCFNYFLTIHAVQICAMYSHIFSSFEVAILRLNSVKCWYRTPATLLRSAQGPPGSKIPPGFQQGACAPGCMGYKHIKDRLGFHIPGTSTVGRSQGWDKGLHENHQGGCAKQ